MTAPAESRISDERLDRLLFALNGHPDHGSSIVDTDTIRAALTELRERRAQAVTVTAWQVREKSIQFDDCEWGDWHQVPKDFAKRVISDGGKVNELTIAEVRPLYAAPPPAQAAGVTEAAKWRAAQAMTEFAGFTWDGMANSEYDPDDDDAPLSRRYWFDLAEAALSAQDREE